MYLTGGDQAANEGGTDESKHGMPSGISYIVGVIIGLCILSVMYCVCVRNSAADVISTQSAAGSKYTEIPTDESVDVNEGSVETTNPKSSLSINSVTNNIPVAMANGKNLDDTDANDGDFLKNSSKSARNSSVSVLSSQYRSSSPEIPMLNFEQSFETDSIPEDRIKLGSKATTGFRIGIDIGGVLSSDDSNPLLINVTNALESLIKFKEAGHQLYIISYSKGKRSMKRFEKLVNNKHCDLFKETYFVSERCYKKDVLNYIGCNVMIDDKESILDEIKCSNPNIVTVLYQEFNDQRKKKHKRHLIANNWEELVSNLSGIQVQTYKTNTDIYSMFEITDVTPTCKLF